MITWKNIASINAGGILKAAGEATERFTEKVSDIASAFDPTKRQAADREVTGKQELRQAITDIDAADGLATLRAKEAGYSPAALAADSFMTDEQAGQAGDYFDTRLETARGEAIDSALSAGGDIADKTRSIEEGRRTMRESLQASGMSEPNIEKALVLLDSSGARQAEYDLVEKQDMRSFLDTTKVTENMSDMDAREAVKGYQGKNAEMAYNELVSRRDSARTDARWTESQKRESALDDAQAMYHESGDIDIAIQHLQKSGLKDDIGAVNEIRQYAGAIEKFDRQDEVEFTEISSRADEQVQSELGLVNSHLSTQQANYDSQIQATSEEIEAERKRAVGGPGIVQLLNQPAENKGWFQRLINVDIQFNDDAAVALGDQLEKAVAAGVPEEVASVFLRKAIYKDYGHHQAIGKGVGVDPMVLNKAMNGFTERYLAAEKDRTALDKNRQAYNVLERELRSSARSYKNAYAIGMSRSKTTGKRANLNTIQREWDNKLNRAVSPGDEADLKELVGEQPTTDDIIERNIRNLQRNADQAR